MGGPRKVRICHLNCVSTQLSTGVDKRHRCDPRTRSGSWYGNCASLTCTDADCLWCDRTNCVAACGRPAAISTHITPSVAGNRHCLCMNDGARGSRASLTGGDSISTLEQSPNSEVADACWLLTVCLHSDFSLGRQASSSGLAENLSSRRRQIGVSISRSVDRGQGQADVPAEQSPPRARSWLPSSYAYPCGSCNRFRTSRQGP